MGSTTSVVEEIRQIEDRDWVNSLREREEKARARFFRCCECGSIDGMMDFQRELLIGLPLGADTRYWLLRGSSHHDVFKPCWQCNPQQTIPSRYVAIGWSNVFKWLASPCLCKDCLNVKEEIDGRNL